MKKIITHIATTVLIALCMTGCSSTTTSSYKRTAEPPTNTQRTDALSMMEVAFVGGYSRATIKARMDRVMPLYDLSLTEDNYERAGSVLVSLRKETGVEEMAIAQCMLEMHVDGMNMQFPSSAALCATTLSL